MFFFCFFVFFTHIHHTHPGTQRQGQGQGTKDHAESPSLQTIKSWWKRVERQMRVAVVCPSVHTDLIQQPDGNNIFPQLCIGCVLRPQTKVQIVRAGEDNHRKLSSHQSHNYHSVHPFVCAKGQGRLTGSPAICIVHRVDGIHMGLLTTPLWILSLHVTDDCQIVVRVLMVALIPTHTEVQTDRLFAQTDLFRHVMMNVFLLFRQK